MVSCNGGLNQMCSAAKNMMIIHRDEILSRPKRTWFVTEKEKKLVANAGKETEKGSKKKAMSAEEAEELKNKAKKKREYEVASQDVVFEDKWPYDVHLLGYIYLNDLNSAPFLWKSVPQSIKESHPEMVAVWTIGQQLWTQIYEM